MADIKISPDTAETIAVEVLKNMHKDFPELQPQIRDVLEYIMVYNEFKEWSNEG